MTNHWLPDHERPLAATADPAALADLADKRARVLARYWDDRVSRENNLSVIDWWLRQARRHDTSV